MGDDAVLAEELSAPGLLEQLPTLLEPDIDDFFATAKLGGDPAEISPGTSIYAQGLSLHSLYRDRSCQAHVPFCGQSYCRIGESCRCSEQEPPPHQRPHGWSVQP